jgi:hypothetical protein
LLISVEPGNQFIYPSLSAKIEKWRYENVKLCLAALNEQAPAGPLSTLQQSYREWLIETHRDVETAIFGVAAPESSQDTSTSSETREITLEAVKMWLEFVKEPYRLIMSIPVESSLSEDGDIILVIQPELRRIGNSNGEELPAREQRVYQRLQTHILRR